MKDIEYIKKTISDIDNLEVKDNYTKDEIISGIDKIIILGDKVNIHYKAYIDIKKLAEKHDLESYYEQILKTPC